jgi:hypothetical protein
MDVLPMSSPYRAPRLTDYGSVASLTLGSATMMDDAVGTKNKSA